MNNQGGRVPSRFEDVDEFFDIVETEPPEPAPRRRRGRDGRQQQRQTPLAGGSLNLLRQEAVAMTVLAQDPDVGDDEGPVVVQISVPADRLQRGPRNHRFHVVDTEVGAKNAHAPVRLHADDPWTYVDKWADATPAVRTALASDR